MLIGNKRGLTCTTKLYIETTNKTIVLASIEYHLVGIYSGTSTGLISRANDTPRHDADEQGHPQS